MPFLLDNDISFRFASALRALDEDVHAMRDVYGADAKDPEWIPLAAADGYVVVTLDRRMSRVKSEVIALKQSKLTVLFIRSFFAKRKFWAQAAWLISRWPKIKGFAESVPKGTVAKVQENGSCDPFALQ